MRYQVNDAPREERGIWVQVLWTGDPIPIEYIDVRFILRDPRVRALDRELRQAHDDGYPMLCEEDACE